VGELKKGTGWVETVRLSKKEQAMRDWVLSWSQKLNNEQQQR